MMTKTYIGLGRIRERNRCPDLWGNGPMAGHETLLWHSHVSLVSLFSGILACLIASYAKHDRKESVWSQRMSVQFASDSHLKQYLTTIMNILVPPDDKLKDALLRYATLGLSNAEKLLRLKDEFGHGACIKCVLIRSARISTNSC
jgi:hypothetical protein